MCHNDAALKLLDNGTRSDRRIDCDALVVGRLLDLLRNLLVEQIDVQHTDKGIFTHSARVDLRIQLLHILTVLRNLGFVLRQSL